MSAPKPPEQSEQEAAHEAWQRGELQVGEGPPGRPLPPDDEEFQPLVRRSAFPPGFLWVAALGLAVLAIEPSIELSWHAFGPSRAVDLGSPGEYRLEGLEDGARVTLEGFASPRRGRFSRWGEQWEVFALVGTPVLVRRPPGERPAQDVAELVRVEGRALKLDRASAGFFERLLRPAARYTSLRLTFEARGELPAGRDVYLVLDGELPRSSPSPFIMPLLLWGLCFLAAVSALRTTLGRHKARRRPSRPS